MEVNKIYQGSCFDLVDDIPDNFVDLVITSPPYADTKSYGKKINVFHPDKYVEWFLPLFVKLSRPLKDSGSVIINIDDKCHNKLRHTYIFDLILRINAETNLKLYDYYFWYKKSHIPNGSKKRLNHSTEWILHFVKDKDAVKWNMDAIRVPYQASSINRVKSPASKYTVGEDGNKIMSVAKNDTLNDIGRVPGNIMRFNSNACEKGNKHPAPYHKELPIWFIKALTDENDVILDPFMGSGTTAIAATELKRQWIGFELNKSYINMAEERVLTTEKATQTNLELFFKVT